MSYRRQRLGRPPDSPKRRWTAETDQVLRRYASGYMWRRASSPSTAYTYKAHSERTQSHFGENEHDASDGRGVGTLSSPPIRWPSMSKPHAITGAYKITHMDVWAQDFVDAEVPGYIRFDSDGQGEFQFGYVHGWIDCEETERLGKPAIEWSWEGNNDSDPANGRGWVVLEDDGTLKVSCPAQQRLLGVHGRAEDQRRQDEVSTDGGSLMQRPGRRLWSKRIGPDAF